MKATRGCRPCDGGTLHKQAMPMDLDVYWCDGSMRERWKQDVPSIITRSINGLDIQNRSRTKDLVISIINNQHPLKRRTNKRALERMTFKDWCPGVVGTVRAVRALLEREPLKPPATQRICTRAPSGRFLVRKSVKPIAAQRVYPRRKKMRALRRFLERKTPTSTAMQRIYPRRSSSTAVTKDTKCRPLATRFFDVLTAPVFQEKKR